MDETQQPTPSYHHNSTKCASSPSCEDYIEEQEAKLTALQQENDKLKEDKNEWYELYEHASGEREAVERERDSYKKALGEIEQCCADGACVTDREGVASGYRCSGKMRAIARAALNPSTPDAV